MTALVCCENVKANWLVDTIAIWIMVAVPMELLSKLVLKVMKVFGWASIAVVEEFVVVVVVAATEEEVVEALVVHKNDYEQMETMAQLILVAAVVLPSRIHWVLAR